MNIIFKSCIYIHPHYQTSLANTVLQLNQDHFAKKTIEVGSCR